MGVPGSSLPDDGDLDRYAEAVHQLPVPQAAHTAVVFHEAATDFSRKALHAVPDILYRALGDLGQGDADTDADAAERERTDHLWMQGQDVSPDILNARYGVPGYLRFNTPTTDEDAAWRASGAREQMFRDQVFSKTRPQPLMDFGTSLAGGLVDPVGLPLMLSTGGLSEAALGARAVDAAAEAGMVASKLGRVANVAAAIGRPLAEGAINNAPYVGANYLLSQYNGDDYSFGDALRDIAMGAVLHTGMAVADRGVRALRGSLDAPADPLATPNPDPQPWTNPVPSTPDAVRDLPTASRAGAFAKAIDDMAGDRPVDVGGYVDRELNPQGLGNLDEYDPSPQIPSWRPLEDATAVTTRGTEVPVRYGLAELSDLVTSHDDNMTPNPLYPDELQPRDRSRAGSYANNLRLEAELNPKLLMTDTGAGAGAPIAAPDGTVESGNGRTIALRRAAAKGSDAWAAYVAELKARGLPIEGMRQPVLTRMRTQAMTGAERAALAREMNADVVERMGPVEQAMADAPRISDQALAEIPPNLGPTTSRDFARDFIARVAPDQANVMAGADGTLSPDGARRIKAAVLARAYGDPRLVGQLFEGEETAARQLAEGLSDAAPGWARMRALAATGQIPAEMDLTPALRSAMDLVRFARQEGEAVGALLRERLGQTDMFSGQAIAPETEAFLRLMYRDEAMTRPESPEKIASALRDYARQASEVTPGENLFGETAGEDTARQILANAADRIARGDAGDLDSIRPAGQPEGQVKPKPGGRSKPAEPGPAIVDVPRPGEPGDRTDQGVPAEAGGQPGEPVERAPSADQLIAADPELKALADDTRALEAATGIEVKAPAAETPDIIAKAMDALAQCALAAPEELL